MLVFCYTVYFAYGAVSAWPDNVCNSMIGELGAKHNQTAELVASYVIAAFTIGYQAFKISRRAAPPGAGIMTGKSSAAPTEGATDEVTVSVEGEADPPPEPASYAGYHLAMCTVCFYFARCC